VLKSTDGYHDHMRLVLFLFITTLALPGQPKLSGAGGVINPEFTTSLGDTYPDGAIQQRRSNRPRHQRSRHQPRLSRLDRPLRAPGIVAGVTQFNVSLGMIPASVGFSQFAFNVTGPSTVTMQLYVQP
jgi:hypothetical protein